MFDTSKNAPPVTAIESLVNDSANLDINSVPAQNSVIYPAQQFQESTLISDIRMRSGSVKWIEWMLITRECVVIIPPCFGFVLKRLLPMPFIIHVGTPRTALTTRISRSFILFFKLKESQNSLRWPVSPVESFPGLQQRAGRDPCMESLDWC